MQLRVLALATALAGAVAVPPSFAQHSTKQQQQQAKRDLKAQQKAEEDADKRQELLEEFQPLADRYAEAMLTRKYSDSLVQGYVSSLGQSLVPPDTPASTTFSFRVVQDIYPNATALPDGRIYLTTGMLAHVDNEAQLAMVLGHEIGHVIEEHALEALRKRRSGQRRNKVVGAQDRKTSHGSRRYKRKRAGMCGSKAASPNHRPAAVIRINGKSTAMSQTMIAVPVVIRAKSRITTTFSTTT